MTIARICPVVIIVAVAILLTVNAQEFKAKRRGVEVAFVAALTLAHAVLAVR
jgi:hypothetical protein